MTTSENNMKILYWRHNDVIFIKHPLLDKFYALQLLGLLFFPRFHYYRLLEQEEEKGKGGGSGFFFFKLYKTEPVYCVSTFNSSGIASDYSRLLTFTTSLCANVAEPGIRLVRKFVMIVGPVTLLEV